MYILIHISMLYVRVCHVWPHVSLFILLLVPYFVSVCFNVFVIQCVGLNLSLSIHHKEFMCDIVHCFALHNNTAELFAALKCKITGRLKQLTQVLVMQHIRSYPWMGDCDDLHMFCTRRVPDWSGHRKPVPRTKTTRQSILEYRHTEYLYNASFYLIILVWRSNVHLKRSYIV